jgi:hypothetical protein
LKVRPHQQPNISQFINQKPKHKQATGNLPATEPREAWTSWWVGGCAAVSMGAEGQPKSIGPRLFFLKQMTAPINITSIFFFLSNFCVLHYLLLSVRFSLAARKE